MVKRNGREKSEGNGKVKRNQRERKGKGKAIGKNMVEQGKRNER